MFFVLSEGNSYKPTYEFPEEKIETKPKEGMDEIYRHDQMCSSFLEFVVICSSCFAE